MLSKIALPALISLAAFVALGAVAFFGVTKVVRLRGETLDLRQKNVLLEQKIGPLQRAGQSLTPELAGELSSALPSANPSVSLLSQIRSALAGSDIVLKGIDVRPEEAGGDSGINKVGISMEVEGSPSELFDFFVGMEKSSPIMNLSNLELKVANQEVLAKAQYVGFWASFPEKIASVEGFSERLTDEEILLLEEIAAFSAPKELKLPSPEAKLDPLNRPSPFSL